MRRPLITLVFLATVLPARGAEPAAKSQARTVVLPLEDQNGKKGGTGEGLALLLSAELSRFPEIILIERQDFQRASAEQALGGELPGTEGAAKLGKVLAARWVVRGSFHKDGKKISLTAQIVDPARTIVAGSANAARDDGDLDAAAAALAKALRPSLSRAVLVVETASDPLHEAHLHLLKGLGFYYAGQWDESLLEFRLASQLAPREPNAFYWLVKTYAAQGDTEHAAVALRRFRSLFPKDARAKEFDKDQR